MEDVKELFDTINIPDTPLGELRLSSLAMATAVRRRLDVKVIPHLKTNSMNTLALKSLLLGLPLMDIKSVLLVGGDPPVEGSTVRDWRPEDVVKWCRSAGLEELEVGVGLSTYSNKDYLKKMLEPAPDFVATQVVTSEGEIKAWVRCVRDVARHVGYTPELYVTLMVLTEKNLRLLSRIRGSVPEGVGLERTVELARRCLELADGLILSSPFDHEAAIRVAREVRGL